MSGEIFRMYMFGLAAGWALVLATVSMVATAQRFRARRRERDWDLAFERELRGV